MPRRTVVSGAVGGAGLAGLASLGGWAYRAAPQIWKRYSQDLKRPVLPAPERPNPKAWSDRGLYAAWLGLSTVLLKIDGVTILADPVFSRRAGIGMGPVTLGLKRLVEPALRITELPKIDLILLSHAHMDHFDLPSLRQLARRGTAVVTAAKTSGLLRVNAYRSVRELGWGERAAVGPLAIRAFHV